MQATRRHFFKQLLFGAGAVALTTSIGSQALAQGRRRGNEAGGAELPLVEPGKGQALSVKYVHNITDIKEAALKVDRQGVKFVDQKCSNCMLYAKHGDKDGKEVGKCTIFANQVVRADGWCMTWSKKA